MMSIELSDLCIFLNNILKVTYFEHGLVENSTSYIHKMNRGQTDDGHKAITNAKVR